MPATTNSKSDVQIYVDVVSNAQRNIKNIRTAIQKGLLPAGKAINALNKNYERLDKAQRDLERHTLGPRKAFQGWALSIMFAGMAIQAAMNSIWQSSSKTFNDVMHSTEGTVTGFDKLQGSMIYLQFVMGQALEPLAEYLTPLIDYISEIVQDHPDAFKWAFGAATIFGTISIAVGGATLAFSGFATAVGIAKVALDGLLGSAVVKWAGTAVGAFSLIAAGIVVMIGVIYWLQDAMGGMFEFSKSVIRGLFRAFVFLGDGIATILTGAFDLVIAGANMIIDAVNALLQNSFVKSALGKMGITFSPIAQIGSTGYQMGDLWSKYAGWEANSFLTPSQGYMSPGMENVGNPLANQSSLPRIGTVTVNITSVDGKVDWQDLLRQIQAGTSS